MRLLPKVAHFFRKSNSEFCPCLTQERPYSNIRVMKWIVVFCFILLGVFSALRAEQCRGITQAGKRCRRSAETTHFCWQHQDQARQGEQPQEAPDLPEAKQCTAKTERGARCSRRATLGDFCWQHQPAKMEQLLVTPNSDNLLLGVPGQTDYLIDREGYAVGYDTHHKQPRWVTYKLTREEAQSVAVSRKVADFQEDTLLPKGRAALTDYRRSGYDRGHLACAGDMRQSRERMCDSFLLSNISPMNRDFNGGVWAKLEDQVRTWSTTYGEVQVVTGPVLTVTADLPTIGSNAVTVPPSFYKVVYRSKPQAKAIGFIIPNQPSNEPFTTFARSVDEVEQVTGLDFFSSLPDDIENAIEKNYQLSDWNL